MTLTLEEFHDFDPSKFKTSAEAQEAILRMETLKSDLSRKVLAAKMRRDEFGKPINYRWRITIQAAIDALKPALLLANARFSELKRLEKAKAHEDKQLQEQLASKAAREAAYSKRVERTRSFEQNFVSCAYELLSADIYKQIKVAAQQKIDVQDLESRALLNGE